VSTDAGTDDPPIASAAQGDAIVGDPNGQLDLGTAVVDYLKGLGHDPPGSCVAVTAAFFTGAAKLLRIPTTTASGVELPRIATQNGNFLSAAWLVTLWFSNPEAANWDRLPAWARGSGAPGALLYADLVEGRSLLTSATGWPAGMKPGAFLQLYSTERDFKDLRDTGAIPSLGHSCVFMAYDPNDPKRIVVSDSLGMSHTVVYPYIGLKYVIAANLSKARLVTFT
jgi:hypothetical protein